MRGKQVSAAAQLVDCGDGCFSLRGELNFETVAGLLVDSKTRFAGHGEITLDLAAVENANSAGMALLLEWRALCHADNTLLRILHLPENLRQISRVCDVEALLDGEPG